MTRLLIRTTIAVILAAPIGWAVWASLQPIDRIFTESVAPASGSAQAPQWENYRLAMTRLPMWRFILNSLLITSAAVVGTVLTASMARSHSQGLIGAAGASGLASHLSR